MKLTRRLFLAGAAAAPLVSAKSNQVHNADVIVIGAGVFGAWTAKKLQDTGRKVLLVDAHGPANSQASSGGESRMTRGAYGADRIYTEMAKTSLVDWQTLSDYARIPLFHKTGVLSFFAAAHPQAQQSMQTLQALGLPFELFEQVELKKHWPQVDWQGVEYAINELGFGALMARRAVLTLVTQFVQAGGAYLQRKIVPPESGQPALMPLKTEHGERLQAEQVVFACGPWMGKLFPDILAKRLFVTRQSVFYFDSGDSGAAFGPAQLPGWADFTALDIVYGFPNLESRGFKIANDKHGAPADPDTLSRTVYPQELEEIRDYLAKRFPALAGQPLVESRVCQYENSSNGDFLIDWHPRWSNALLVGMGSGHGFKHGPAVGELAAAMLTGAKPVEPRFSLASKKHRQARSVH